MIRKALVVSMGMIGCVLSATTSHAQPEKSGVQLVAPEGDLAKYWTRWRGPAQGVVDDAYPDRWSDTENVMWKVKAPHGNSSPIIWKDRLIVTAHQNQGKTRMVVCFDRTNGELLWECRVPKHAVEGAQGKNGWASGTPTTDGERVYAYFGTGGLFCCDLEGRQVWHNPFPVMDALHGMAGSPLLFKDKVIIFQESKTPSGFIAAYDKRTGKELWNTPRKETVSWGSPIAVTVDGKEQIIVSSSMRVYGYDPEDGKEIWSCAGNLFEVIPTPVVGHDLLFCCSGRAGPTLAIRPSGAQGDITKTNVAWKTVKGSPFVPSPLLYGDYLYTVNDVVSVVSCFDARSGKQLWQERCGHPVKEGFSASPIGVGGKVFFTNDDGETFVMEHGPKFNLLHVNRLGEKTLASPALVDGRWYIRTQLHLWCIGKD